MENFKMYEPVNKKELIISQTTNDPSVKRDMDMFNINMTIEDIKNSNEKQKTKNKKILELSIQYLDLAITEINEDPTYDTIEAINIIQEKISNVKELGWNTSKYEKLIPNLTKKVLINSIEKQIKEIEVDPTYDNDISVDILNTDILKLKSLGVDTSKYEKLIPSFRKKVKDNHYDNYIKNALKEIDI